MQLTKRETHLGLRISLCATVVAVTAISCGDACAQAQPDTSSKISLKGRRYAPGIVFAHHFATRPDLTDASPGYGGADVSYEVLDTDKNGRYEHVKITNVHCLVNPHEQEQCLTKGGEYYIAANTYETREIRDGLVTGLLAIPFKYHFTDHAVTAGATIGAYVGYEKDWSWIGSAAWVVGGGLALVPVSTTTTNFVPGQSGSTQATTSTSDSTINGITVATGLIGRIGQTNAQFGVLFGTDLVNKSHNYKYDGKPWLSFSFAYAFSGEK